MPTSQNCLKARINLGIPILVWRQENNSLVSIIWPDSSHMANYSLYGNAEIFGFQKEEEDFYGLFS